MKHFEEDFNRLLQYIRENNLMNILEKSIENFSIYESSNQVGKYVNFQLQLFSLINTNTPVLLHYLKTQTANFIPEKSDREIFQRLERLKGLCHMTLIDMDQVVNNPTKIKGNLFSYSPDNPYNISATLIRFDGQEFNFTMDFNSGLQLTMALTENLVNKFNNGSNNIDRNLFNEYRNSTLQLINLIENLILSEEVSENTSEVNIQN